MNLLNVARLVGAEKRLVSCSSRDIIGQLPDLIEVTVSSDSAIQCGDFIVPRLLSVN